MAYYPTFQPYPYHDQLNQLRTANPLQGFQLPRPDPSGINWVQGEAGAKSWIVAPGSTALLMDSETMRFYLKTADLNGVPSLRAFDYTEVGQKPQDAAQAPKYVTMDEFDEFRNEVMNRFPEPRKRKGEANEQPSV